MEKKLAKIGVWMAGFIACCVMMVCPVRADVIWEPMGDTFYEAHAGECEYQVRSYTANGPDGKVIVYKSPEDATETAVIENGKVVSISYTYMDENGVGWGVYENWETDEQGWLPMDYMEVVYDHISFEEDYGELIKEQEGALSNEYSGQTILIWDYPGAEKGKEFPTGEMDMPTYREVYVDEAGRSWGKIGYYYGWRNCWICLDAPTADYAELYPSGSAVQEKLAEEQLAKEQADVVIKEDAPQIVPKQNNRLVELVVGIVGGVVVVTGVLLGALKKRRK